MKLLISLLLRITRFQFFYNFIYGYKARGIARLGAGEPVLFILQTPTASHEIMLLSKTLSKDLYVLLYACITGKCSVALLSPL